MFSWYQIAATNTTQNPTPVIASREHFYFGLLETAVALAVTPAVIADPGRKRAAILTMNMTDLYENENEDENDDRRVGLTCTSCVWFP